MIRENNQFCIYPPRLTPEERRQIRADFECGIRAQRTTAETRACEEERLDKDALSVLVEACRKPKSTLTEVYQAVDLHPTKGKKTLDMLIAEGLVHLLSLARMGKGAKPCFVEVLSAADKYLERAGVSRPEPRIKGSWKHNLYGLFCADWAVMEGHEGVEFEKTFGSKTYDVSFHDSASKVYGAEICLSGTAERTAEQVYRATLNSGIHVIAVFESKLLLDRTKKDLAELYPETRKSKSLEFRLLGEFVTAVLEGR